MMILGVAGFLLTLVFFLPITVLGGGAALAQVAGVSEQADATITVRELRPKSGRRCAQYKFTVVFGQRSGDFTVCLTRRDDPLLDLEVGEQVEVLAAPWVSEVTPVRNLPGQRWVAYSSFLACVLALVLFPLTVLRYRALHQGRASGECFSGRVVKVRRNSLTVELEDASALVLIPVVREPEIRERSLVTLWSSRRSLLGRGPRGPWVVSSRDVTQMFHHGWRRRSHSD